MPLIQSLYKAPLDDSPTFISDDLKTKASPCLMARDKRQLTCTLPMCATCQFAKARKRPTKAKLSKEQFPTITRSDELNPGDCFSVDQYESSVRGRLPHTRGRESQQSKLRCGTIYYDHASTKIFIRHQTSTEAAETINGKRDVERECLSQGVLVKQYQTDNGIFKSKAFEEHLRDNRQTIRKSGVGAKHQNGTAERAIGTIQNMARAMLLHLRIYWPDQFDSGLWPFAMDYAVWIYNNVPTADRANMCPDELFSRTRNRHSLLRRARVFGSPTYVLDPRLQDGKKIPKWNPRARQGMFLGFSPQHASTVALVMNLETGAISPQFHTVFDERFETVAAEQTVDPEERWIDLWKNSRDSYLNEWDIGIDGPLPGKPPEFDSDSDSDSSSSSSDDDDDEDIIPITKHKDPKPWVKPKSGVSDVEEVSQSPTEPTRRSAQRQTQNETPATEKPSDESSDNASKEDAVARKLFSSSEEEKLDEDSSSSSEDESQRLLPSFGEDDNGELDDTETEL